MTRRTVLVAAMLLTVSGCEKAGGQPEANQPQPSQQAASAAQPAHTIVTADQVTWSAGPPSLQAGAEAAVLYGDPSKEGVFVMRLRLPPGFRIAPHTHPRPEILTVISGAFHIGMGNVVDEGKAQRLAAGGFFAFDPGLAHYAHVEEETVVQLSSTGPWAISYVNAGDDPRQK